MGLVSASGSNLLLLPFQDAVGARERVNVPGTVNDQNWTYRVPADVASLLADGASIARLRDLAARSGRIPASGTAGPSGPRPEGAR